MARNAKPPGHHHGLACVVSAFTTQTPPHSGPASHPNFNFCSRPTSSLCFGQMSHLFPRLVLYILISRSLFILFATVLQWSKPSSSRKLILNASTSSELPLLDCHLLCKASWAKLIFLSYSLRTFTSHS